MNALQLSAAGVAIIIISVVVMLIWAGGRWDANSVLQFYLFTALEIIMLPVLIAAFIIMKRKQRQTAVRPLKPVSNTAI